MKLLVPALFVVLCACGPGSFTPEAEASGDPSTSTSTATTSTDEPSDSSDGAELSTSATSTTLTTTSDGFVPEYDMFGEPCDPLAQDCPEGQKCVPYGSTGGNWDASKCVPVLGDQGPGEPCHHDGVVEATDDCDALSFCWDVMDVDGELIGTCAPFCQGDPSDPECPPGYQCLISESIDFLCIKTCDPLAQDCTAGLACYWAANAFNCIFTTQDIPIGEPCGFINDCAAGLICLSAEFVPECADAACCSAFCDLALGDGPCAALPGSVCSAFFEDGMAPAGYENVGVCILPP